MASYREMDAVGRDPSRVRVIAKTLLQTPDHQWSDWEIDFLERMAAATPNRLSTRQAEVLFELKEEVDLYSEIRGIKVTALLKKAYDGRADLDDGDDDWVAQKYQSGVTKLRLGDLMRLKRLCVRLQELEPYM